MSQKCKFIQINLHHSEAAMALLCPTLATGKTYSGTLGLWGSNKGRAQYKGALFSAGLSIAPRSCIFLINTVCALPLSELRSMDVEAVRVTYTRGQKKRQGTVTSPYLS
jgi:hypothetical protein